MITAIILSSGSGQRFKESVPKQFSKLAGLPVIVHTLLQFQRNSNIDEILVVANSEYIEQVLEYLPEHDLNKVSKVVQGGATRQESSRIGLECCSNKTQYVLIHDGVRPFISQRIINELVEAVKKHAAVDTVIRSADTIVQVDDNHFIKDIPDRFYLRRGQTPQAFEYSLIYQAHLAAETTAIENATDDCALVMSLGKPVYTVLGEKENIKLTYPIDLHIADKLFQISHQSVDFDVDKDKLSWFFRSKRVAVIGGTSGIGKSLVNNLIPFCQEVLGLGRKTKPGINILDCGSIESVLDFLFKNQKNVDFLVNCAGDLLRKNIEFTTLDEWDYIYNLNLRANFILAKTSLPYFKRQNFGTLIFVGSSSYTRGRGGYAAYSSSKAALVNFCQAFAEEINHYHINVNVISPGRVDTPLRYKNFGKEDKSKLLDPNIVAQKMIQAMMIDTTGSLFEVL